MVVLRRFNALKKSDELLYVVSNGEIAIDKFIVHIVEEGMKHLFFREKDRGTTSKWFSIERVRHEVFQDKLTCVKLPTWITKRGINFNHVNYTSILRKHSIFCALTPIMG